jgi:predicted molibdopterin-dependent oxidoreductase YjgC
LLELVPSAGGTSIADAAGRVFKLIYLLGADRVDQGDRFDLIRGLLERAETVIAHSSHQVSLLDLVDLVLPVRMNAEKRGTLVNHAGRVQRIEPAVLAPGEAEPDGVVLAFMAEKLEEPLGTHDPAAVFAEMAERVPAFRGLRFAALGDTGKQAQGTEVAAPRVAQISVVPQPVG